MNRTIRWAALGTLAAVNGVLGALLGPAGGYQAHATTVHRTCHLSLPVTYGEGWAQLTVNQSCGDAAWVWARFHSSPHYTEYGPHRVAPPGAPKYSVVGSGSGDGWGVPYCGGRGRWYSGARHYTRTFGSCTTPGAAGRVHTTALVQRGCTANYYYYHDQFTTPGTAYAKWTSNTCGYWLRPFSHCHLGRSAIITTGRWVQADGTKSNANCTNSYPSLTGGGLDKKNCSTCAYTRHWLWGNGPMQRPGRRP